MALRISLVVLAALLLGAHFLRAGNLPLLGVCAASPLLFLYRKRWSLIAMQIMAYLGAGSWVAMALQLIHVRQLSERPWAVAASILGAVALFTLVAGLLLNSRSIRERYPL